MKKHIIIIRLLALALILTLSCSFDKIPKNVIIIIGDGTGFDQLQAGSLYLYGEPDALLSQSFPVKLAVSTFSANGAGYDGDSVLVSFDYLKMRATDSAASATALSTGHKTYNGAIGVDTLGQPLKHLFEIAEENGKSTGVVTSVPLSHATPAGFIAHNESRNNYHEIAEEMIMLSATDVILGCGHPFYDDDSQKRDEPEYKYLSKKVWDAVMAGLAGVDADGDGEDDPWSFIELREDFQKYAKGETPKRLLGIPRAASTLQANRAGRDEQTEPFSPPLNDSLPSLAEMAAAAINVLDNNPNGFYLMIEAGAIDWACHANHGPRMIEEVVDMERMVETVVEWIESNSSWKETHVVITADHETAYLTGPASGRVVSETGEETVVYQPLVNNGKGQMPGLEFHSGGHSNSLVPLFAHGARTNEYRSIARQTDPQRGPYLDNTDIPKYIRTFFPYAAP